MISRSRPGDVTDSAAYHAALRFPAYFTWQVDEGSARMPYKIDLTGGRDAACADSFAIICLPMLLIASARPRQAGSAFATSHADVSGSCTVRADSLQAVIATATAPILVRLALESGRASARDATAPCAGKSD